MGKERISMEKANTSSSSQSQFGPALPPSMNQSNTTQPSARESWMQDSDSLDFLGSNTYDKKEAKNKKEKTPEYDYSAPGLHVIKKSTLKNNRLFSSHKESSSIDDSKSQLHKMKARFKNNNINDHSSDKRPKGNSSHFRAPTERNYSHQNRKRVSRSRSKSPRKSASSRNEARGPRRRSGSSSPRKEKKQRSRSKSPEIKYRKNSVSKSDNKKDRQRSRSKSPEIKYRKDSVSRSDNREDRQRCRSKSPKLDRKEDSGIGHKEIDMTKGSEKEASASTTDSSNVKSSEEKIITNDDLNKLSARILKAEISGNAEKVTKLNTKLEGMKKLMKTQSSSKPSVREEVVVLTKTDSKGNARPVELDSNQLTDRGKKRRKEKIVKTHDDSGERDKYFPDDKTKDLLDLLQEEKSINKIGQDQLFMKYAGKLSKMSSDRQNWTIDDMFESNIAKEKSTATKDADRMKSQSQKEHKRLESCHMCLEKCSKDSIVFIGKTLYIRVPIYKSLATYQCQIVPVNHIIASVNGDEDFWEELRTVKSSISKKFASKNLDAVFLESAQRLGQRRHIFIDCVPVPIEDGTLLPAYFKKAILDCDVEWAQNKKLVDTRHKSLRKSVPQGLPYFSVEFGTDGGFAHVIEEESLFKRYFGLEVVGGVIDCDVNIWRNPAKETSEGLKYKKKVFEKLSIEFE
ncbi:CWF19-like protein 2 [Bolinopsis microptera]|uniref:CWF19-like protein 2 n=1 Tax=Bolinopsis microptera TaxID=2820187 RepID=UPI00307A8149